MRQNSSGCTVLLLQLAKYTCVFVGACLLSLCFTLTDLYVIVQACSLHALYILQSVLSQCQELSNTGYCCSETGDTEGEGGERGSSTNQTAQVPEYGGG